MDKLINKVAVILFLYLILPVNSFAQIQGTIRDSDNHSLTYANVVLINQKDSSLVTGTMTSDVGTFSITNFTPGRYRIKISMLGYKTTFSEPFEIKSANGHIHLPSFIVEEDTKLLAEVDVVAKKPIYELQIDRMVVNVENSITSAGSNALEVLEKSPGVIVDRQNKTLSMGGKEGVLFMINGKESRIPMEAAIEMLGGMRAENVKKIELITTPPSRYEAEGNAGIINIVLKKGEEFGTNGDFALGLDKGIDGKANGNFNINHHVKKVNFFGMYSYSYDNDYQIWNAYRMTNQNGSIVETTSKSKREPEIFLQNARLGFDYTISSKTILGILATGYSRDWENVAFNKIENKKNKQITDLIDMHIVATGIWTSYTGNLNMQHFFRSDEILEFNTDYLYYYNTNPSKYGITYRNNLGTFVSAENLSVKKNTPINTWVVKLDYAKNIGDKTKLESGIKYTNSRFVNDIGLSTEVNGISTVNPDFTNIYRLFENIGAIYSSVKFRFNTKTEAIAGLRFEYTNSVLNSDNQYGIVDRHYGKFFPSVFLSHEINKNATLQFAFSRRITRPTYNDLAPFILFQSPNSFVAGNDKLQPAISNVLKTDFKYKTFLVSLTGNIEKSAISNFQPEIDLERNLYYLTSKNIDQIATLSIMISFPVQLTKWWKMQNILSSISQNVRTNYSGLEMNFNRGSYRLNTANNFIINKLLSAEFSGFYQSSTFVGISKVKGFNQFILGIQAKSKNERSKLSLNFTDVFKGYRWTREASINELNIHSIDYFTKDTRVLSITYWHKFGNNKVKVERHRETGSEEERNRVTKN